MSDIKTWSKVAGENSGSTPDYGAEGHARTQVSDITREMQASIRRKFETMAWFDKTDGPSGFGYTITRLGDTQFKIEHETTPTDAADKFDVGARIRIGDGSTYVYGFVTSRVYSNPATNVTVDLDGASVIQTTPTLIELNITDGTVGNAAFSAIGSTTGQDPPQLPSIDLLGDGALLDQGTGNGFDADTVDGLHAVDLIAAATSAAGIGLINGNFEIGQRGHALTATTSFPCDNAAYVADGWALLMGIGAAHPAAGSGVVDVDLVLSGATVGKADTRAIRLTANANIGVAPVEKVGLIQWMPNDVVGVLAGTSVSLSAWANRPAGTTIDNVRIGLVAWSGAVDTLASVDPVSDWNAVGVLPTMEPSYTLFASDSVLPSINWGEIVLENISIPVGTTNLAVMLWVDDTTFSVGSGIEFSAVRLATGATAQSYTHEDYATNLQRCQRFFNSTFNEGDLVREKGGDEDTGLQTTKNASAAAWMNWEFGTSMFKTPTVATYNPAVAGTLGTAPWSVSSTLDVVLFASHISKRRVNFDIDATAASTGNRLTMHATADASL